MVSSPAKEENIPAAHLAGFLTEQSFMLGWQNRAEYKSMNLELWGGEGELSLHLTLTLSSLPSY